MLQFDFAALGQAITDKRNRMGYSAQDVADASGVNLHTLRRAEVGLTLEINNVLNVCAWLNKSVNQFVISKPSKNGKNKKAKTGK